VKSKDIRIESLQEQLSASSQEASRLIASLRAKLFELELSAESSSKPSSSAIVPLSSTYSHLVPFHSPNPFQFSDTDSPNANPNHSQRHTPQGKTSGRGEGNGDSDDLFADLAGNVFPQSSHRSSRNSQRERGGAGAGTGTASPSQPQKPSDPLRSSLPDARNYISSAYRLNSKTGSPRPVSPSEASSSHLTDATDPTPRVSKPSDSMRNLFHSKHNNPYPHPAAGEGEGSGSQRPPLRGGGSSGSGVTSQFQSQSLLSASSPVPSPHRSQPASRHSLPAAAVSSSSHPASPLNRRPSPSASPSPSHDILQALLAQSSSSPTTASHGSGLPLPRVSSREKTSMGPQEGASNEDILDSLLKRRGISSAQRSSRSADSNRS
jgi:hypothetical protein